MPRRVVAWRRRIVSRSPPRRPLFLRSAAIAIAWGWRRADAAARLPPPAAAMLGGRRRSAAAPGIAPREAAATAGAGDRRGAATGTRARIAPHGPAVAAIALQPAALSRPGAAALATDVRGHVARRRPGAAPQGSVRRGRHVADWRGRGLDATKLTAPEVGPAPARPCRPLASGSSRAPRS